MKQYTINDFILQVSWLLLGAWVLAAAALIVLLAMRSPYWFFSFFGIVFFYLWMIVAASYPKTMIISDDSVAFIMMGSDKVQTYRADQIDGFDREGYYELAVKATGRGKKFLISKRKLSKELEEQLVAMI